MPICYFFLGGPFRIFWRSHPRRGLVYMARIRSAKQIISCIMMMNPSRMRSIRPGEPAKPAPRVSRRRTRLGEITSFQDILAQPPRRGLVKNNKTAGREELAVYFTSRKRRPRLRLRLTCQPPLRGGRRSPNSLSPGFAFGSPASRRCAAGAARRTRFSISNFREYCTLLYYFLQIFLNTVFLFF